MKETVKKTKTPAKPRKSKTVAEEVKAVPVSHEEIAQLAHKFWTERGWQAGYAEQDWLRAEQELLRVAS